MEALDPQVEERGGGQNVHYNVIYILTWKFQVGTKRILFIHFDQFINYNINYIIIIINLIQRLMASLA